MRKVEVTWVDSRTVFDSWTMLDEISKFPFEDLKITSIGYVYQESDDLIVLVQNHGTDQVLNGIGIPTGAVLCVKELL